MKTNRIHSKSAVAVVALAMCAGPAIGQESEGRSSATDTDRSPQTQMSSRADLPDGVTAAENYDRGRSARDYRGYEVIGANGEKIGRIKDFAVDTSSGQIVFAVVGSGGFLGIGEKQRAVPYPALTAPVARAEQDQQFALNIDEARWEAAPLFADTGFTSFVDEEHNKRLFEYYDADWSALDQNRKLGPRQDTEVGRSEDAPRQLILASKINGRDVMQGTREVGQIQDIIIHRETQSASLLLKTDSGFAGESREFLVPFRQVAISTNEETPLSTELAAADFESAAPASRETWESPNGMPYVWTGFGYPGSPDVYAQGDVAMSDQRQQDVSEPVRTTDGGDQRSELSRDAVVAAARDAIHQDDALREHAYNVQVSARDDSIILSGVVPNDQAKDQIQEKVEQAASGWEVQNNLTVRYATD